MKPKVKKPPAKRRVRFSSLSSSFMRVLFLIAPPFFLLPFRRSNQSRESARFLMKKMRINPRPRRNPLLERSLLLERRSKLKVAKMRNLNLTLRKLKKKKKEVKSKTKKRKRRRKLVPLPSNFLTSFVPR